VSTLLPPLIQPPDVAQDQCSKRNFGLLSLELNCYVEIRHDLVSAQDYNRRSATAFALSAHSDPVKHGCSDHLPGRRKIFPWIFAKFAQSDRYCFDVEEIKSHTAINARDSVDLPGLFAYTARTPQAVTSREINGATYA
jgi:hypothetical protein